MANEVMPNLAAVVLCRAATQKDEDLSGDFSVI